MFFSPTVLLPCHLLTFTTDDFFSSFLHHLDVRLGNAEETGGCLDFDYRPSGPLFDPFFIAFFNPLRARYWLSRRRLCVGKSLFCLGFGIYWPWDESLGTLGIAILPLPPTHNAEQRFDLFYLVSFPLILPSILSVLTFCHLRVSQRHTTSESEISNGTRWKSKVVSALCSLALLLCCWWCAVVHLVT